MLSKLFDVTCYNVYKPDHTLFKSIRVEYPDSNQRVLGAAIRSVPKTWISATDTHKDPCVMQCFILETVNELCYPLNLVLGWLIKPKIERTLVVRRTTDLIFQSSEDHTLKAFCKIKITDNSTPFDIFVRYNATLQHKFTNIKLSY